MSTTRIDISINDQISDLLDSHDFRGVGELVGKTSLHATYDQRTNAGQVSDGNIERLADEHQDKLLRDIIRNGRVDLTDDCKHSLIVNHCSEALRQLLRQDGTFLETELILAIEHDLCLFVKEALSIGQPFEADGLDAAVAKNNAASWLIVGEAIAREKDLTDSAFLPRHFDAALESGPIEIVAVAFLRLSTYPCSG